MPRKRTETVIESLATLAELREQYREKPQEDRLTVLYLLKEDPSRTLEEVSSAVGCSERTVRRWWSAYKQGGLGAVLDVQQGGGGKPARISDEEVGTLVERLKADGITDAREIRKWLKEELGLDYSLSGVRYLIRTKLKVEEPPTAMYNAPEEKNAESAAPPRLDDRDVHFNTGLINFLNSFSTSSVPQEWLSRFRDSLLSILHDVDRISINIDLTLDFEDSRKNERIGKNKLVFRQSQLSEKRGADALGVIDVSVREGGSRPVDQILHYLLQQGVPVDQNYPPAIFDYYLAPGVYLGTMLLWRELGRSPISQSSIDLVRSLEPFILFMLSDIVARHQRTKPMDTAFKESLQRMMADASLSVQEQRVVYLQLLGCSYKETADLLRVSLNTIRHHLKSIHTKTNTRSQSELFAKYFTPLMPNPNGGADKD